MRKLESYKNQILPDELNKVRTEFNEMDDILPKLKQAMDKKEMDKKVRRKQKVKNILTVCLITLAVFVVTAGSTLVFAYVINGGPENDFDKLLGGVNVLAMAGNGERVVTNLLNALAPVIEKEAKKCFDKKVDEAVGKAQGNRAARRAKK